MNILAFCENVTNKYFNYDVNALGPRVFKLNIDPENIYKLFKEDTALRMVLNSGKDILIEDYFNQLGSNQLILETASEEYFSVNLSGIYESSIVGEIQSVKINNLKDVVEEESVLKGLMAKWRMRGKVGVGGSQRLSVFNLAN